MWLTYSRLVIHHNSSLKTSKSHFWENASYFSTLYWLRSEFQHIKCLIFFSKHAHTHRYQAGPFFIRIFFQHAHTHRSEFLNMVNFLFQNFHQVFFFQNTHTRTDNVWIFIRIFFKTRTHAQICLNFRPYFFQNTHTRTDMNFTKWLICFISKCLNCYPCFFLKRCTHTQKSML